MSNENIWDQLKRADRKQSINSVRITIIFRYDDCIDGGRDGKWTNPSVSLAILFVCRSSNTLHPCTLPLDTHAHFRRLNKRRSFLAFLQTLPFAGAHTLVMQRVEDRGGLCTSLVSNHLYVYVCVCVVSTFSCEKRRQREIIESLHIVRDQLDSI